MNIDCFEDWWNLKGEEAEAPNTKEGDTDAWSYVTIIQAPNKKTIFLKRQQNFYPNNLLQRWRKELTFEREYENYLKVKEAGIPTYDLIYFSSRKHDDKRQAIYVAEGLENFTSLVDLMQTWKKSGWPSRESRRRLLQRMVETIRHMHQQGILHNALSPRHIFINMTIDKPRTIPDMLEFRLIDFERLKTIDTNSEKAITRDLFSLHRRCVGWPNNDRIWFLKQYLGISNLDDSAKNIIRSFIKRVNQKS
ncbi:MAG: lipopolysaccharide kinase InaA family protein [Akkermansiaceae bacterium]